MLFDEVYCFPSNLWEVVNWNEVGSFWKFCTSLDSPSWHLDKRNPVLRIIIYLNLKFLPWKNPKITMWSHFPKLKSRIMTTYQPPDVSENFKMILLVSSETLKILAQDYLFQNLPKLLNMSSGDFWSITLLKIVQISRHVDGSAKSCSWHLSSLFDENGVGKFRILFF